MAGGEFNGDIYRRIAEVYGKHCLGRTSGLGVIFFDSPSIDILLFIPSSPPSTPLSLLHLPPRHNSLFRRKSMFHSFRGGTFSTPILSRRSLADAPAVTRAIPCSPFLPPSFGSPP
ncbi:hypothetical protein TNCV_4787761 [Trichonephila clavipes]|nr:hypothetical protein TNCV_4787761 [Trichonephila clavipes]